VKWVGLKVVLKVDYLVVLLVGNLVVLMVVLKVVN
jgi:hypothetical protein